MHVQPKPGRKKEPKNESTTRKTICFRIEPKYPNSISKSKIGKGDCKLIAEGFKNLSILLLGDTNINCKENKKMVCKKCYCVCCSVQRPFVPISTITPPWNYGNPA